MLHAAAKQIVRERGGSFPTTSAAWRELPGIGPYTAAAIASIVFGEAAAVVDGNVERVLERLTGARLGKKKAWHVAGELVCALHPGDFNQSLMELGATVCTPQQPACVRCPVNEFCLTRGVLTETRKETRQKRDIHYALDVRDHSVLLVQRPLHSSLMPGLWELPEIQANGNTSFALRHSITVTDYRVHVSYCSVAPAGNANWVHKNRVAKLPLTGLARKILRNAQVIPANAAKSSRVVTSSKIAGRRVGP
jgi:A/G-specific adenine glycosylase